MENVDYDYVERQTWQGIVVIAFRPGKSDGSSFVAQYRNVQFLLQPFRANTSVDY